MGVQWDTLPTDRLRTDLFDAIQRNTTHFNPQNIANTLLAINQMGVQWDTLPTDRLRTDLFYAIQRNVTHFNPQNIANTLLAINQMAMDKCLNQERLWSKAKSNLDGAKDLMRKQIAVASTWW